ncbi:DUF3429 domain-containing protein [Agarivorans sp. DSG3-1]|uniref:DUF3429 domain-containing protein n=1 Tax=Agarivorans sp. DSG3-1 TaxID=3342249 RepID=UPI00398EFF00
MDKLQRTITFLGYAGLSVFIALCLATLMQIKLFTHSPQQLFVGYSAVILSFLCGSLWAQALNGESHSSKQLIISNLLSVLSFVCLMLNSTSSALILLAGAYIVIYYREWHSHPPSRLSPSYQRLRLILTCVVVSTHLLILAYQ